MSYNEASVISILFALLANLGIAVNKTVAAVLTGSGTMLAESIHSCADSRNQGLLFRGLRAAWEKPDSGYPLGYGMEICFWLFIAAINGVTIADAAAHIQGGIDRMGNNTDLNRPMAAPNFWVTEMQIGGK